MFDIGIIGGGPSGMSAALTAKWQNPKLQVCIIEKNPILGKKIYATGNGKCNLSHLSCPEPMDVLKFFNNVGIFTRADESGRMYPASEQASDVVAALENALRQAAVEVRCDTLPKSIVKTGQGFEIQMQDSAINCKKLLIATGGKAGPQYGNLGEGYAYAKQLGHHVSRIYPVLSPLECEGEFQLLKGIRAKGKATLLKSGNPIATETGEIQFAEDGLSGICIFNLSRFVRLDPNLPMAEAIKAYAVSIDFIPGLDLEQTAGLLHERAARSASTVKELLLTMVHTGISDNIMKRAAVQPDKASTKLSTEDVLQIAGLLKHWPTDVTGVKGWKKAQCTGGGIPLSEIDVQRGASILADGLYFAGELLDYDGPSGGFNLHYAWESGIKAGKAMADESI